MHTGSYWSAVLHPFVGCFQSFLEKQEQKNNQFSTSIVAFCISAHLSVPGIWHQLFLPTCRRRLFSASGSSLYEWSSISELCQASLELTESRVLWSQLCWSVQAHWSTGGNIKHKRVVVCYWWKHENAQVEGGEKKWKSERRGLVGHTASLRGLEQVCSVSGLMRRWKSKL